MEEESAFPFDQGVSSLAQKSLLEGDRHGCGKKLHLLIQSLVEQKLLRVKAEFEASCGSEGAACATEA